MPRPFAVVPGHHVADQHHHLSTLLLLFLPLSAVCLGVLGSGFHPLEINSVPTHAALLFLEMGVGVGVLEATQTSPEYGHLLLVLSSLWW